MNRKRLLIILGFLGVLDVALTVLGLSLGLHEGNPVGLALIALGPPILTLSLAKLAGFGLIALLQRPLKDSMAKPTLLGCNVFMAAVVTWNLFAVVMAA